jgi:N-methylhydantoinase B/oxoprolinase/acetone carboxylase alpha subunit
MVTSLGGTSTHDGTSIVLAMNHFTPGTPVEIIETEYPVMVRRYDIWRDPRERVVIAAGWVMREYQLLVDCILTARTSNHRQGRGA